MRKRPQTKRVRSFDKLGRIVIPIEIIRSHGIKHGDGIEIYVEDGNIVLRKYQQTCCIFNGIGELRVFNDKSVCLWCIRECKRLTTFIP